MQRAFDTEQKAIKYVRRWIGEIKDFYILPKYYKNADLIEIEIENQPNVKILTPLGHATKIREVIENETKRP